MAEDKKQWQVNRSMYVMGMPPACARKVAKFHFNHYFVSFSPNPYNNCYEICIEKDTPQDLIDYFLDFWNEGWVLYIKQEA